MSNTASEKENRFRNRDPLWPHPQIGNIFWWKVFCENFWWFTDLRAKISHIAVSRRPVLDFR